MLFIDRLPMHGRSSGRLTQWTASLPVVPTDPVSEEGLSVTAPVWPHTGFQRWVIDTAFTGEAFAWRHHLEAHGLDVRLFPSNPERLVGFERGRGQTEGELLRRRNVTRWLFSNIPAFRDHPFPIELGRGVAFRDVGRLPDPERNCPLLGMSALSQANIQVYLDFSNHTISVWVPGLRFQGFLRGVGRLVSRRWRGAPVPWERPPGA